MMYSKDTNQTLAAHLLTLGELGGDTPVSSDTIIRILKMSKDIILLAFTAALGSDFGIPSREDAELMELKLTTIVEALIKSCESDKMSNVINVDIKNVVTAMQMTIVHDFSESSEDNELVN